MTQELKKLLESHKENQKPTPIFFNLSQDSDQQTLIDLLEQNPHTQIIDTYESQLLDYFVLQNPPLYLNPPERDKQFEEYKKDHYGESEPHQVGKWVYLAWRHTLLHILEDDAYQVVRTGRNRNLILPEEQEKYYNSAIGIAGQSVGNSCTLAIVQTGGGKHMRIADMDTLELTNLNRIRGSIADITSPKVHMTARQVYELDPYANLELFGDGLTEENIEKFFDGPPKLDVVIDEIDNLEMKIRIRQEAKKRGIPVLMATDNGDSGVLDIERYDKDKSIELFNGRAGNDIAKRVVGEKLPLPVVGKIIGEELLGYDVVEERVLESLLEIGKSIPTWPQLGSAATLNGVLVAVAARRIINNQPLEEKRVVNSLLSSMDPDYHKVEETQRRTDSIKKMGDQFSKNVEAFLSHLAGKN